MLVVDLDGTLHRGPDPLPGAGDAMAAARAAGRRLAFVTNNASRTPAQVVAHLTGVGVTAREDEVLTAAQAGAAAVARLVPPGSSVLVVGGDGLVAAIQAEGLVPVGAAAELPAAVVQGWFPRLDWPMLAEAAYCLSAGLPWVATNLDRTLPTAGGLAPGNGAFVELLAEVTGRRPDAVPGKPGAEMLLAAASGQRALVVGDRLDTDIAGANAAGLDSLLVLTGVCGGADLLAAQAHERPTYVASDLSSLALPYPPVRQVGDGAWQTAGTRITWSGKRFLIDGKADQTNVRRALCTATWTLSDAGEDVLGAALAVLPGP